jgi:hypothetical protein
VQRLLLAVFYGTAATLFAASGHGLAVLVDAPEHSISLGGLATAWLLAVMTASVLSSRRATAVGVAVTLGLGQLAFHGIFALTAHGTASQGASPADQHALHTSATALGQALASSPVHHSAQDASAMFTGPMVLLHVIAWAASVVVVLRGRTAVERASGALPQLVARAHASVAGIARFRTTVFLLADALAMSRAAVENALRVQVLEAAASLRTLKESRTVAAWGLRGPPAV